MTDRRVSVVIPVFNGERYLAEAIESVLAQTAPPFELIVLDDGSTDGSAAVADRYPSPVRRVSQANAGLAAAQNRGAEVARGDLIAYLDCDDLWEPEKLALQGAAIAADPSLDLVFGHVVEFLSPERADELAERFRVSGEAVPGLSTGAMLARRDVFARVGPFDSGYRIGEFVDWYSRAAHLGLRTQMLPEVVMRRRIHDTNMGLRERHHQKDYLRLLKAGLDRRRRSAPEGRTPEETGGGGTD